MALKTPDSNDLRLAAMWLEQYEAVGEADESAAAMRRVGAWLDAKAEDADVRAASERSGFSVAEIRRAMRRDGWSIPKTKGGAK